MPRVVVASDKFKGSLSAAEVGAAVAAGLRRARPDVEVTSVPVADGGDGTVAAALAAGFEPVEVDAHGPTGEPLRSRFARRGDLAVVELADASGLGRLRDGRLAPLLASSRGTGQVLAAARAAGCRQLVLGLGGSACTDGGAGLVAALGARLLDRHGDPVGDGGAALASVAGLDLATLQRWRDGTQVVVACDVDNPLTGRHGAAPVYGPQKGADADAVRQLDAALARWADVVAAATGEDHRAAPGAGAAGGVGFAAIALLGAERRSGAGLVLDLVGFDDHLAHADLVVTGEGSLDEQTLRGKAVAGVADAARAAGVPTVAVCGRTTLPAARLREAGLAAAYPLAELEPDQRRSMADASALLEQLGARIAAEQLPPAGTDTP